MPKRFEGHSLGESRQEETSFPAKEEDVTLASNETAEVIDYHSQKLAKLWRKIKKKKRDFKEEVKRKEEKEAAQDVKHISGEFENEAFKNLLIEKRPTKESGSLSEANTNAYNYNQPEMQSASINYDFQSNGKGQGTSSEPKIVLPPLGGKADSCGQSLQQQSRTQEFRPENLINSNQI